MKNKIRIYYDDDPDSIIGKINDIIKICGYEITDGESGDGWVEYHIVIHDELGEDICE